MDIDDMKKKILIFPAGSEIALEILNALKYSKFVEIYGGTSTNDHSEFVFSRLIKGFPHINEEGFLKYLNKVIYENHIDCIYPAHDSVSVFLSENSDKINAQVIITDVKTTLLCRSKKDTYSFFKDCSFVPKIYNDIKSVSYYPVFVKPSIGQGSIGAKKVDSKDELSKILSDSKDLVICEYLPNMEYTVDCFTDKNGKLLVTKFRNRERIKNGIAVRSTQLITPKEVIDIANIINSKLHFIGAWFFQLKQNENNEFKLLEISPRIPGTNGLSRNTGINYPLLTLFTFWGYNVSIIDNNYNITLDRAFYSAYKIKIDYDHVYLDYDDTITLNGYINPDIMRFIYQAINRGKKLHIISKHNGDLINDMINSHVDIKLFDTIRVIDDTDEKYNYIDYKNSIFIDDSFLERKKVSDKLGIPVFDIDMVESLIDWKI